MADSENTRTAPKPNDDPALAMCVLWHADCDQLEEAVRFASIRERAVFDATDDEQRQEAQRVFLAAAKVRDRRSDKLEILTRAIFKSKAQSFEGAAAKLSVAVRDSQPGPDEPMPPWPYLRSVQTDLDRLVAAVKEAAANENG